MVQNMEKKLTANKKILFVLASLRGGGAERLTVDLANAAVDKGYQVTLYVACYEGPYIDLLSSKIKIVKGLNSKFSRSLFPLKKLIKSARFHLIFCSQEYVISIVYFALLFSGRAKKCKLIAREASTPSSNVKGSLKIQLLKYIIKAVYNRVDKLIAPTASVKDDLKLFYGLNRNVEVMNNPISKAKVLYAANQVSQISENLPEEYIISVGRLIETKGVQTILTAIRDGNLTGVSLVILGDGDYRKKLENLAFDLNLSDRVFFLGFKPNPFPYISRAKVFISGSEYEGMPNTLLQASILNVPCISSLSTGVVHDLVDDSFIFRYGDATTLSEMLRKVYIRGVEPRNKNYQFISPSDYLTNIIDLSDM